MLWSRERQAKIVETQSYLKLIDDANRLLIPDYKPEQMSLLANIEGGQEEEKRPAKRKKPDPTLRRVVPGAVTAAP